MPSRGILVRLLVPLCAVASLAALLTGWWLARALQRLHEENAFQRLIAESRYLESLFFSDRFDRPDVSAARDLVRLARSISTDTHVTVIGPDGTVWADSAANPAQMPPHGGRLEVAAALAGQIGRAVRQSDTTGVKMMYVARPLQLGGRVIGVLRTAIPLTVLEGDFRAVSRRLVAAGAALLLAVMATAAVIAVRLQRPLATLTTVARALATGDLSSRAPRSGCAETDTLADALNHMAAELQQRILLAESQQREMETMLESLTEGVIAIDTAERLLFGNRRAADILGTRLRRGADLRETVRLVELQQILVRALREGTAAEAGVSLTDGRTQRFLHGRAAPLTDPVGGIRGAVMVLNDLTEMNRLLTLRREFVANVTHELQTPLTTIRGFLETLTDPQRPSPEDQQRFLQIALRQTRRLQRLVEDLMELARLDQAAEQSVLRPVPTTSGAIANDAAEACAALAAERNIRIEVRGPPDLAFQADADLVTRALVNLLDNAIKYSPPGGTVELACRPEDGFIVWSVTDHGPGIEAVHLPRLFERFYRVDKSRSRREGGTGLGLAIVKHIVLAHGGTVGVESEVGRGSCFWFRLPRTPTSPNASRLADGTVGSAAAQS
ncbi:MAG: ATP-binding protein [Kiritimatiellae bacterium]|nr:ATP-binding protein [Kiritimatiellia bacterium]